VLIFFVPLYSLLESVLIGFKQFGKILLLVVIEKITELALLLFFLFILRLDYLSLFYSTLISTILTVIFAVFFIKKIIFSKEIVPGKEVKKFAFQSWITNVSKGFMSQSEIWVFGLLLSLSGFGILYLVKKLTIYLFEAPQIAVSEVVLPFLSEEKDPQKILPILFPKFLPGAGIFSVLVLGHVFYFGIPLSRLFKATNNNNALTLSFLVYMALILIMGFLLTPEFGLMGAAITLSSARIISGLFLYLMSLYKGYKVSVIPTLSDFIFFRQSSETLLKLAFAKTKRFFNPKKSC
jgi:O-antigen/teichoic acid export membrane protein